MAQRFASVHNAAAALHIIIQLLWHHHGLFGVQTDFWEHKNILVQLPLRVAQLRKDSAAVQLVPRRLRHRIRGSFQQFPPGKDPLCKPGVRRQAGYACLVHRSVIAQGKVCPGALHGLVQCFVHFRCNIVVGIHKADPLAPCHIQPGIAGSRKPAVFLVKHPDAGIFRGSGITQRRATVRRTVLHKDQLKVRKGLRQNGIDAFLQIVFHLVHRHNDAEQWFFAGHSVFLPFYLFSPSPRCAGGQ